MNWLPMFVPGHHPPTPLWCALCGRRFRNWHGVANHGLMHVEQLKGVVGAARARLEPSAEGHRYVFESRG